ncbi:MAG: hypothetical protein GXP28_02750 [Planctomycetes bacterium]|nr:hypothetical protein [Planctomycetota bacterium]
MTRKLHVPTIALLCLLHGCSKEITTENTDATTQSRVKTTEQKQAQKETQRPAPNKKEQLYASVKRYVNYMKKKGPQTQTVAYRGEPGEDYARRNEALLGNGIVSSARTNLQITNVTWIPEDAEVNVEYNDGWDTAKFRHEMVIEASAKGLPGPLKKRVWGKWIPVWYNEGNWTLNDPSKSSFRLNE